MSCGPIDPDNPRPDYGRTNRDRAPLPMPWQVDAVCRIAQRLQAQYGMPLREALEQAGDDVCRPMAWVTGMWRVWH